jgi:hypothetical protein
MIEALLKSLDRLDDQFVPHGEFSVEESAERLPLVAL